MITIGIDPGRNTGVAIVNDQGKLVYLNTTDFWGAFSIITTFDKNNVKAVHIEDTSDLPVFHKTAQTRQAIATTGRRVGEVCAEARLLADGLERYGYKVIRRRQKKSQKLNAMIFKRLTGWKGRTNQHQRDAAALII